jgi:hypothetical protein
MPGTFGTSLTLFGGVAVDRDTFRRRLPDARWLAYAAGWVDPGDANTATISLRYEKDDGTTVLLGSVTQAGAGRVKKLIGPVDVFGTGGVPAGEAVPMVRIAAQKAAGVNGTLENWTLWIRYLAPKA